MRGISFLKSGFDGDRRAQFVTLLLIAVIFSCSPTRRANRLINRAKVLDPEIFIPDTVRVDGVHVDTIIEFRDVQHVIEKERLKVVIQHDTVSKTIQVKAECKEKVIVKERLSPNRPREKEWWEREKYRFLGYWAVIIGAAAWIIKK